MLWRLCFSALKYNVFYRDEIKTQFSPQLVASYIFTEEKQIPIIRIWNSFSYSSVFLEIYFPCSCLANFI